ncbi:hypothetical protein BU25DRAFT_342381, partial [Macroventuria anomochaeta]
NGQPDAGRQYLPVGFNASQRLAAGCAAPGCDKVFWEDLSRCTGCGAALYCGKEHQHVDRPAHKEACSGIKKATLAYQEAERQLREEKGDDILGDGPPHFWGIQETRPYIRARLALAEALLLVDTEGAVALALKHLLAMLHLCRSDNMGVRDLVPALYLRLGRDQEAYDFCKWWVTTAQEGDYDWGNRSSRFLHVKDPKDFVREASTSLAFAVSVTLIKIRLLIDLQALMRDRGIASPKLPSEIIDQSKVHCASSIILGQRHVLERDDQTSNITAQRRHIKQLFEAARDSNKHFWPALVRVGDELETRRMMDGFGGTGQMQMPAAQRYHHLWAETEGAIGVIEELLGSYTDGMSDWA